MNLQLKPKIRLNATSLHIGQSTVIPSSPEQFDLELKPYRNKVLERLEKTQIKNEYIKKMEEILYQKTITEAIKLRCSQQSDLFKSLYLSICRHIIANLTIDNNINNKYFIEIVNNNQISLEKAVEMTPQEMHQDRWRVLLEKKLLDIDETIKDPEATTDLFWCSKCHRNKCKYFERQDRSADEPMTIHITCCNCGRHWKQ